MKRKLTMFLALFFIGIGLAVGQTQVRGTVVDETGDPVIGATIQVKGTLQGTVSDINGIFTLSAPAGGTLVISYVGCRTQEVAVNPKVDVILISESELLDEVMIVAYGTARRSSFTGSAKKVDGEKIAIKNPSEVSKALEGEVAGVQVFNTSGQPGSNATIRIRGIGSVNSNNAPLFVVDGMPYSGDLSSINPSDIESTTVLKDATAAALYGSRAANGVILITTKKGDKGKTKVEAELKSGFNTRIVPLYSTINSPERFTEITWEGLKNKNQYATGLSADDAIIAANSSLFDSSSSKGGIDAGYNMWNAPGDKLIDPATGKFFTNINRKYTPEKWADHIFRTGQKTEANLKISGGADQLTFFTSFGYLKDQGYYIGSDFSRFNVRNNVSYNVNKWLKSNTNLSYSHLNTNSPGQTDSQNNGFQFVNFMPPLFPVFERDENGKKIEDKVVGGYLYDYGLDIGAGRPYASGINPAGAIKLDKDNMLGHDFNATTMFEATFLNDFKATVNAGIIYYSQTNNNLSNPFYGDAKGLGRIYKNAYNLLNYNSNQILLWTKELGYHHINAFAAHEFSEVKISSQYGQKSLLVRSDNTEWSNAVIMGYMDSYTRGYSVESYFGQIRYDYDEKYHLNLALRSDGSSRFLGKHKWGTFGSIGAAWLISKESFMADANWINTLKYKASWGKLGNQNLLIATSGSLVEANYYPYEDLYSISNQNNLPSFTFLYKGNPNLTWESSTSFNTGLEFTIFNRIEGEFEFFHKKTTDMLFMKQMSPSLGYARYPVNDGAMINSGFEFTINADVIKSNDIKLAVRLNGGIYQNKLTKMPLDETTGKEKPLERTGLYGWSKGHSYYDFYLREYAGVDPESGLALYNQYYNMKADGTEELILNMVEYESKNKIEKLDVRKTDNYDNATLKYVDKSAIPAVSGGFGFDFYVKGFELNTTFSYSLGGYAYDVVYATLMSDNAPGSSNWHVDMEGRWRAPGDKTDIPRIAAGYDSFTSSSSTRFLTSRSYLNLTNVRLAYNLPKRILNNINANKLSIYVSGDNLLLLSARQGFVAMSSVSGESQRSQYLPVSTIMGGVKIEF